MQPFVTGREDLRLYGEPDRGAIGGAVGDLRRGRRADGGSRAVRHKVCIVHLGVQGLEHGLVDDAGIDGLADGDCGRVGGAIFDRRGAIGGRADVEPVKAKISASE